MTVKTFQSLVPSEGIQLLAPQLDFITTRAATTVPYQNISAIDASGGLTTLLSLTGKWWIRMIFMSGMTSNDVDHYKLTVDGVVVFEEDGLGSNNTNYGHFGALDMDWGDMGVVVLSSFLLQMETNVDTSMNLSYIAQPIL